MSKNKIPYREQDFHDELLHEFAVADDMSDADFMSDVRRNMQGLPSIHPDELMKIRDFPPFIKIEGQKTHKKHTEPRVHSPTTAPFYPWIQTTTSNPQPHSPDDSYALARVQEAFDSDFSYTAMNALLEYYGENYPPPVSSWNLPGRDFTTMDDSALEDFMRRIKQATINDLDEYYCTAEAGCTGRVIMTQRKGNTVLYAYCYKHIPMEDQQEGQNKKMNKYKEVGFNE